MCVIVRELLFTFLFEFVILQKRQAVLYVCLSFPLSGHAVQRAECFLTGLGTSGNGNTFQVTLGRASINPLI